MSVENVQAEAGSEGQFANTSANETSANDTAANQTAAESRPGRAPKQMLYRHPNQQVLGGVCGGLAELVGWDPALLRILWVVATLATGGGGILAYIALWALLPVGTAEGGQVRAPALELNERNLGRTAVALIALGAIWFLANIGVLSWVWSGFWQVMSIVFWPALLIGAGYVLLRYSGKGEWNWRTTRGKMQSSVGERMPTRESLGQRFNAARRRFPIKRSREDRIFMGVCGGIGQRIGIDANLVRLVWAAFSIGSIGMGVLLYVIFGLFLPQEQVTDVQPYQDPHQDDDDGQVIDIRTSQV